MRKPTIRLEGTEQLLGNLQDLEKRVLNAGLEEGLTRAAEIVVEEAGRRAPVLTGALSHEMRMDYDAAQKRAKVGPGPRTGWYGYFQEIGTSRMAANPFLRPALVAKAGEVARAIGDGVRRAAVRGR